MTQKSNPLYYFDILRALHRGGLSLWLNRHTLLPMTLIPFIVTFLTLMMMRSLFNETNGNEDVSHFVLALIQIPADFVTGIFCALIIFIIMNAPKKDDKDKPIHFTLNIMERKDLLLGGAIAHVIIGYFASGFFGVAKLFFDPIAQNPEAAQTAVSTTSIIATFVLFGVMIYMIRFLFLPILIVGKIDAPAFFKTYKALSFSWPIFVVKFITTLSVGFVLLMVSSLLQSATHEGTETIMAALSDLATAFASLISTAWFYAAMAVGIRQMLEGNK